MKRPENAPIINREFLSRDPSEWDKLFTDFYSSDVNSLAYEADKLAQKSAFLASYLEARGADGTGDAGHEEAIQQAIKAKQKVRKALGYTG